MFCKYLCSFNHTVHGIMKFFVKYNFHAEFSISYRKENVLPNERDEKCFLSFLTKNKPVKYTYRNSYSWYVNSTSHLYMRLILSQLFPHFEYQHLVYILIFIKIMLVNISPCLYHKHKIRRSLLASSLQYLTLVSLMRFR